MKNAQKKMNLLLKIAIWSRIKRGNYAVIEERKLSPYAKIKLQAENKIKKLKNLKGKVNLLRIPKINTKQNLLITKHNLPNFRNLIENNKKLHNIVFFKTK